MKKTAFTILVFAVAVSAAILWWPNGAPQTANAPEIGTPSPAVAQPASLAAATARPKPAIPHGSQTYNVTDSANKWPKILRATIDPPDVHVGMTQKLSLVVQPKEKIVSVVAEIETDHGTSTVELSPEKSAVYEIAPQKYFVDASGNLQIGGSKYGNIEISEYPNPGVANAAEEPGTQNIEILKYRYSGSWVVRDTHDTFYRTTFIAKDISGDENSVTLAWSDACAIPNGGNWTMTTSCTIAASAVDGVENGNASLNSGTLTINSNSVFVWNSGKAISFNGGNVVISASSGKLQKSHLWMLDPDGDGVPSDENQYNSDTSPGGGYVLRSSLNATYWATADCAPSDINAWVNRYVDGDGDGTGAGAPVCVGSQSGYADTGTDCNDASIYVYMNITNLSVDVDHDGYIVSGPGLTECSAGGAQWFNGRPYYITADGSYPYLWSSNYLGTSDCSDSDADTNLGQTAWFTSSGGNGWDYNCNSATDQEYTNTVSCTQVSPTYCGASPCFQIIGSPGWLPGRAAPGCGVSYHWASVDGYFYTDDPGGCSALGASLTQGCH